MTLRKFNRVTTAIANSLVIAAILAAVVVLTTRDNGVETVPTPSPAAIQGKLPVQDTVESTEVESTQWGFMTQPAEDNWSN